MKTHKSHRHEQLKSYLTNKPSRRKTHILHPMNRDILMGVCKTISGVVGFTLFVVICFAWADIAGSLYGTY